MALRDLYKKHHWQLVGPTFYQMHLLFDKHYDSPSCSRLCRSRDCCTPTRLCSWNPEPWPGERRILATTATNDMLVSDVIRRNELLVWFLAEHVVDEPLVRAK